MAPRQQNGGYIISVNQLESNLQAVTSTIAHLESRKRYNVEVLEALRKERDKILKDLNIK